jgi:hypothetical protein
MMIAARVPLHPRRHVGIVIEILSWNVNRVREALDGEARRSADVGGSPAARARPT